MNQPSHTDPGLIPIEPASIEYYNPTLPQPLETEADPAREFQASLDPTPAENKPVPYHRPPAERHSRKCQICHHPERDQIEEDFLLWRPLNYIAHEYNIPQMAVYRHAHALGHFKARRDKMRLGLDRVIERGPQTLVTADQVIRAVRAQACLTDDNRWIEPARQLIISNEPSGPIAAQGVILATGSHRQQIVAAQLPPTEAPQNN